MWKIFSTLYSLYLHLKWKWLSRETVAFKGKCVVFVLFCFLRVVDNFRYIIPFVYGKENKEDVWNFSSLKQIFCGFEPLGVFRPHGVSGKLQSKALILPSYPCGEVGADRPKLGDPPKAVQLNMQQALLLCSGSSVPTNWC